MRHSTSGSGTLSPDARGGESLSLMSGGEPLTGSVVSIGKAIADSNTSSNGQLLPQVQQTFNWVRLAQRIPVDIKLDPLPEDINISAGMTVSIYLQEAE